MADEHDPAWDRIIDFSIRAAGAFGVGALIFLDLLMLDVFWARSMLVSWIVIACYLGELGVWTIRKLAIVLTVYAVAYLLGATPSLTAIGAFLTRAIS